MDGLAKVVVKLIVVVGMLTSLLHGQQRNTVLQTLASNVTLQNFTTSGSYQITNNIGQVFHTFAVNGVGSSCNNILGFPFSLAGNIQGSYDNTSWFDLTQVVTGYIGISTKLYRATGAYPFVRFRVVVFPTTLDGSNNCSLTFAYSGTLNGTSVSDASNPNFVFNASGIGTTCTPILNWMFPAPIQTSFKIVGYSTAIMSGTPTQVSFYTNSSCSSNSLGTVAPNQTILPDIYLDTVLGSYGLTVYSTTWSLYAKTNAGTVNIVLYMNCMN